MTVQVASVGLTVKVSALNMNGNGIHIYRNLHSMLIPWLSNIYAVHPIVYI